jgi:hypothetical protein
VEVCAEMKKLKRKRQKTSLAEKIMKVLGKQPKAAEEIRKELKDRLGCTAQLTDIRVNLLYLLRREHIQREKGDVGKYRYFI